MFARRSIYSLWISSKSYRVGWVTAVSLTYPSKLFFFYFFYWGDELKRSIWLAQLLDQWLTRIYEVLVKSYNPPPSFSLLCRKKTVKFNRKYKVRRSVYPSRLIKEQQSFDRYGSVFLRAVYRWKSRADLGVSVRNSTRLARGIY